MTDLELVWTDPKTLAKSWIRELLSGFNLKERVEERPTEAVSGALYVVNTNISPLASMSRSFVASVASSPGVGLFNTADEWLKEDYRVYSAFSYVLRTYWSRRFASCPNIMVIPLGRPGPIHAEGEFRASSDRLYDWTFFGSDVNTRIEMHRSLQQLKLRTPASNSAQGGLPREQYLRFLQDSVFAPCPMGNALPETWRLYESLECGAIPVLERRLGLDYFTELFGVHPLPTFRSWKHAGRFMQLSISDGATLEHLQHEIMQWWSSERETLKALCNAFVSAGARQHGDASSVIAHERSRRRLRRVSSEAETIRYCSPEAFARRLIRTVRLPRMDYQSLEMTARV